MRILVACEESQAVCIAFRNKGHEAYSCDIQDCSGGHPEWHIKGDAIKEAYSGKYDMMIAHPPCTYLSNSGVCWLYKKPGRWEQLDDGAKFFKLLLDAPIEKIAIENPVPHKYAIDRIGRKYDQSIQPYQFGHAESKRTCFWLKNLDPLRETKNVKDEWKNKPKNEAQRIHYLPPGPERAKLRSKTFHGIAEAIANQWGGVNK
jgi:hypothetical protein